MRKANVTEEQISRILEMQREGHPYKVIAAELQITDKTVSAVCLRNGIRRRRTSEEDAPRTLTCPKCKRDGFPADYLFCPYCAADIRTERDKLIDLLERTQALFTPPIPASAKAKHTTLSAVLLLIWRITMNNVATRDPCAGFDFDCRSPYYEGPKPVYTGGRCQLCGCPIKEDEPTHDNGYVEFHWECFTELPDEFILKRLGWKKIEPAFQICEICGETIDPPTEGYMPDECYEKDGKHIHFRCFHEQDTEDVLKGMNLL